MPSRKEPTASIESEEFHKDRQAGPIGFKVDKQAITKDIDLYASLGKGPSLSYEAEMVGIRVMFAIMLRIQPLPMQQALRASLDEVMSDLMSKDATESSHHQFLDLLSKFFDSVLPAKLANPK